MSTWWRSLWSRGPALGESAERAYPSAFEARLAVYHSDQALPQISVLAAEDCLSLIDTLCRKTQHASQERGGVVPLLALREIVENLLHASFQDVVVSVLPDGSVLVSDHGPGISDKERAMRPGFTTASTLLRRYIRGVGSGLTVAEEALQAIGGALRLEDNLAGGTVVSLLVPPRHQAAFDSLPESPQGATEAAAAALDEAPAPQSPAAVAPAPAAPAAAALAPPRPEGTRSHKGEYTKSQQRQKAKAPAAVARSRAGGSGSPLTARQERLFRLFSELPEVGPSAAATGAELSLASAYRELVALERFGLLEPLPGGKRRLSSRGGELLATLTKR
jgi:hypothetical protein